MPKFRINKRPQEEREEAALRSFDIDSKRSIYSSGSADSTPAPSVRTPEDSTTNLLDGVASMAIQERPTHRKKSHSSRKASSRSWQVMRAPQQPQASDVLIVGAGPAGLMLASNLVRFGINAEIIDSRSERTLTGRADGLQPKTIETFKQMRIADSLLLKGVKVQDIRLWKSSLSKPVLRRMAKETHFPSNVLDCADPYLLLAHQGFVEDLLLRDILERGVDVQRETFFVDYRPSKRGDGDVEVLCKSNHSEEKQVLAASYVVGCDGAHSYVRKAMGARMVGSSTDQVWGVIDGEIETDFPDLYSKTVIHSEEAGAIILLPRERNMSRLYVEIRPDMRDTGSRGELTQEFVMDVVREVFEPYQIRWRHVEWFGRYQIGQKVASKFSDESGKVLLAGDSTHTHSPNGSQGMNTSIHDSCNLAWKLNLTIRGLAKPCLMKTYEEERRDVAETLIAFDHEHTQAFRSGNMQALAQNFHENARFMSGYGADYPMNVLNIPQKGGESGMLRAGSLPTPAMVTRAFDSNPVPIQLDIPLLGQFRLYFFAKNLEQSRDFLEVISAHALSYTSILGKITSAANASYTLQPPLAAKSDAFTRPERYTTVSGIFTFALVLQMRARDVDIEDLPLLFQHSKYTVYTDDVSHLDTRYMKCTDKWLGAMGGGEVGVVVLRPDGYVGTVGRFAGRSRENGARAARWLDEYFNGFLVSGF